MWVEASGRSQDGKSVFRTKKSIGAGASARAAPMSLRQPGDRQTYSAIASEGWILRARHRRGADGHAGRRYGRPHGHQEVWWCDGGAGPERCRIFRHADEALNNVDVDFCVAVAEMGPLLIKLVQQPYGRSKTVPSDIRTEALIAERVLSDVSQVNGIGEQVPYNCPGCGGVLWELDTPGEKRYRCPHGPFVHAPRLAGESV